jgi:hypothetical protein
MTPPSDPERDPMAQPAHLVLYLGTDQPFTFPRDPDERIWSATDIVEFAAVHIARREGFTLDDGPPVVEYDAVAAMFADALDAGTIAPYVCPN